MTTLETCIHDTARTPTNNNYLDHTYVKTAKSGRPIQQMHSFKYRYDVV